MLTKTFDILWTRPNTETQQIGVVNECDLSAFKVGNLITGVWGSLTSSGVTIDFYEGTENEGKLTWGYEGLGYYSIDDGIKSAESICEKQRHIPANSYLSITHDTNLTLVAASNYKIMVSSSAHRYWGPGPKTGRTTAWSVSPQISLSYNTIIEKVTELKQVGDKIYEDISIPFNLQSQNTVYCEVYDNDIYVKTIEATASTRVIVIPAGTIRTKTAHVKIRTGVNVFGDMHYSEYETLALTGLKELVATRPSNIRTIDKKIYENIEVLLDKELNHTYKYILYVNEEKITESTYTLNNFIISHGTILSRNDNVRIEVYSKIEKNSYVAYSDKVIYNLTGLEELRISNIENLRVVGTNRYIEENIVFEWGIAEDNILSYVFEAWQMGAIVWSNSRTSSLKLLTFDGGTLKSLDSLTFKVACTKTVNGYTAITTSSVIINNLGTIAAIIKDFAFNQNNRDYPILVTPEYESKLGYEISFNVAGVQGLTIPFGILTKGSNEIELVAKVTSTAGVVATSTLKKTFEITQDEPIIYSLEPYDLNVDISKDVPISFILNEFVDKWTLKYTDKVISGTKEREYIASGNLFRNGLNGLTLEVEYSPIYDKTDKRYCKKTVGFIGCSNPSKPVWLQGSTVNTSTPTLLWDISSKHINDQQDAYNLIVKKGDQVIEKIEARSKTKQHIVKTELENNTDYVVELMIKNKYGKWSEPLVENIRTSFNSLPNVDFEIVAIDGGVTITPQLQGDMPEQFYEMKVFRKDYSDEDFRLIAQNVFYGETVTDYGIRSNILTEYKIRLYDIYGGYAESSVKSITILLDSYRLIAADNLNHVLDLDFVKSAVSFSNDKTSKYFANATAPVVYESGIHYASISLSITLEREQIPKLQEMLRHKILLYRDYRGNRHYMNGSIESIKPINHKFNSIEVMLIEVRFNEPEAFSIKNGGIITLNNIELLNGEKVLRGYK